MDPKPSSAKRTQKQSRSTSGAKGKETSLKSSNKDSSSDETNIKYNYNFSRFSNFGLSIYYTNMFLDMVTRSIYSVITSNTKLWKPQ
jgi:hypothetical protein